MNLETDLDVRFMNKLDTLDKTEKAICNNYFTKKEAIDKVLDVLRNNNLIKKSPFGNSNAKIFFVIDFDKTNDRCIELIKKYYEANKLDIYSSYFTPFSKTDNAKINFSVLSKELEILKPTRVLFITDNVMPEMEGSVSMLRSELETLLNYGKIKSELNEEQESERVRCLNKLHKLMEFAMVGKR